MTWEFHVADPGFTPERSGPEFTLLPAGLCTASRCAAQQTTQRTTGGGQPSLRTEEGGAGGQPSGEGARVWGGEGTPELSTGRPEGCSHSAKGPERGPRVVRAEEARGRLMKLRNGGRVYLLTLLKANT